MTISVAGGKGGAGKTAIDSNINQGYRFWGYFPFTRVFTYPQVEGKTILEYDNNEQIKLVFVGPWKNLRQEIQK